MLKKNKKEINEDVINVVVDKKADLVSLLKLKMPSCFDREPQSGTNSNVDKLADEILNLL